ncbi:MAG: alpha-mannosidase [Armatimonadetes bacterium]|nr:alpha-mannosidase [Armatimonadota bacterium]
MPNTLHVVSHTHWDREWYMPFEHHRLRLLALMDLLLEIFETEPDYRHFHTDGQMIPFEDYLEVRPHRQAELRAAAQAGKLSLGPWYVLQDEALTSAEANVRNMMYGLKLAREFGEPLMVGYLPDTFGHFSQMPQLLRGFGIDNAVFGRGVNRYDAAKAADPDAEPGEVGYKSELIWRSPDGSEVLGVFLANWYSNAMDIPADPHEAAAFLERARDAAQAVATTPELLLMNGCDHTPTRRDVGRVIEAVRELLDDEIVHTSLAGYLKVLRTAVGDLQAAEGELRSEYTNGWGTLADTLSARLYQKQANWRCQQLLERWSEPLSAFAAVLGQRYPSDELWYAWATLMKNHPHDSICGCSCDEVHSEMDVRFDRVEQVGCALRDVAAQAIGDAVDDSKAPDDAARVLVFNPTSGARTEIVTVDVEFPADQPCGRIAVVDENGTPLAAKASQKEPSWGYKLPDDRFRTPYDCTRMACQVLVPDIPGVGYKSFYVRPLPEPATDPGPVIGNVLENEYLRVELRENGILDITEKESGVSFAGLNVYEDGGDCGDEYIYRAPAKDTVIRTDDPYSMRLLVPTDIDGAEFDAPTLWEDGLGCRARVCGILTVPRSSDRHERDEMGAPVLVTMHLALPHGARSLQVTVGIENHAQDHRLRALFPTGIETQWCYADSQFDIVRRSIQPSRVWQNPSNPQPQQAFVDITDGEKGLCIANRGLPSYEVLRDGSNTIAITLLRCVGEIGDWGKFPTPNAQCTGTNHAEYAVIPHAGQIMDPENCQAARTAWEYANPAWATQVRHFKHPHPERWSRKLPATARLVSVEPSWLALSSIKLAEAGEGVIVRLYNPFDRPTEGALEALVPIRQAFLTNLAETRQIELACSGKRISFEVPARKIVTLELVPEPEI